MAEGVLVISQELSDRKQAEKPTQYTVQNILLLLFDQLPFAILWFRVFRTGNVITNLASLVMSLYNDNFSALFNVEELTT
jgi:hypothetical protein